MFISQVQSALDDLETITHNHFGATFSPLMKRILVFTTIYECISRQHRNKLVEHFNPNLAYPVQVRDYMSKYANILENPFKSTNTFP